MRCASSRGCELRKSALEDCLEQPLAACAARERLIWPPWRRRRLGLCDPLCSAIVTRPKSETLCLSFISEKSLVGHAQDSDPKKGFS